jgi:hypothetical protein
MSKSKHFKRRLKITIRTWRSFMHDSTTLKKNNEKDIISAICLYYG